MMVDLSLVLPYRATKRIGGKTFRHTIWKKRANKFHCFLLAKKKKVNKIPLYRTAPVDIVRANLVRQRRNPCGRFSVAYPRRQLLSHALEKGAVSCCRSLSIRRLLQIIYSSL